jgi:vacuolar protein sorting-associated protein 13A/C
LIDGSDSLATLSLSTADVAVFLRTKALRVTGRLGNLALSNDKQAYVIREDFNHILSIDGQNFAEFRYQTFDPDEDSYTGVKSAVYLNAASVKLLFFEEPLHDIYLFFVKLAKLKGLYDAATQVAVQRASEIERMQFEVSVKSPILIFPPRPTQSRDVLVMRLGEISARNTSEPTSNKIAASLNGIQLASILYKEGQTSTLKIIDDVDVTANIIQGTGINRETDHDYPDNQVRFLYSSVVLP